MYIPSSNQSYSGTPLIRTPDTPVFRPLRKVLQIHPWNVVTPLIRTLSLVPRVAGLEGFHCSYVPKRKYFGHAELLMRCAFILRYCCEKKMASQSVALSMKYSLHLKGGILKKIVVTIFKVLVQLHDIIASFWSYACTILCKELTIFKNRRPLNTIRFHCQVHINH